MGCQPVTNGRPIPVLNTSLTIRLKCRTTASGRTLPFNTCPLIDRFLGAIAREQTFRFREEIRTPVGVRKSPKNEPAGPWASHGDLRFRRVPEGDRATARSIRA